MKYLLISISILISASSFIANPFDEVIKGIKSGNAAEVGRYFDNTVEITFPEKSNNYNKSQAVKILLDFFSSNTVIDFEILHKSQNSGSTYCIGNLKTANGTFRTTIFMKQTGNKDLVQELKFEK